MRILKNPRKRGDIPKYIEKRMPLTVNQNTLMNNSADVLLVNPAFSKEKQYGFKVKELGNIASPPLGLAYIAAVLLEKGFSVTIIDANAENLSSDEVAERARVVGAKIVGVTATTPMIDSAFDLAKSVKRTLPEAIIVFGGPHVSVLPVRSLNDCPELDFVVIGEGEITAVELFGIILDGEWDRLPSVSGVAYRDKKSGNIVVTSPRPLIEDISVLPLPRRQLLPMSLYKPSLVNYRLLPQTSVLCSRGCPHNCIFCTKHLFGRKVRRLPPENVYQELKHLKEAYGIKEIDFYDECFVIDHMWTEKVCDLIKPLSLIWQCNGHVKDVSIDILKKLKEAGCYRINYGVESGNDKSLKLLRKGSTTDMVRKAFRLTHQVGIETLAYMMLGIPGEDWDDMMRSIEFVKEIQATDAVFTILTPFPGNEIYNNVEKYGVLRHMDWKSYICISENPVFLPYGINQETLNRAINKAYREFALRPKYIYHRFRDALQCPHKFLPYAKGALSLVFG